MTSTEAIFIAARAGIALLCLIALAIVWHHGRTGARFDASQRTILIFTSLLLLLASVLTRELAREGRMSQLSIDLVDRPGQLARVATLLGEAGANIVEVSHQRVFSGLPAKGTLLDVVIETRDRAHRDAVVAHLREAGFMVEVHTNPGGAH